MKGKKMKPETLQRIEENFKNEGIRRGYSGEFLNQYVAAAMKYWREKGEKPPVYENVSKFKSER